MKKNKFVNFNDDQISATVQGVDLNKVRNINFKLQSKIEKSNEK